MRNNLKYFRKKAGLRQWQLAEKVGLTTQQVSRLERQGQPGGSNLSTEWLPAFAQALGCEPGDLISGNPETASAKTLDVTTIPVIGEVKAGYWQDRDDLTWHEDKVYRINAPADPRLPGLPRFGLEIRGDSMNERYREGDVIVCVGIEDYGKEPKSGARLVIYRTRLDGTVEATCKKLFVDESGKKWLMPESTNPEHQALVLDEIQDATVSVHAIVTGSFRREEAV